MNLTSKIIGRLMILSSLGSSVATAMEQPELTDHSLQSNTVEVEMSENEDVFYAFLKDFFELNPDSSNLNNIHYYKKNYKNGIFSASNIEKLPESISTLPNLTSLDLFFCPNLTSLPNGIGELTNLTKLSCSASEVKSLPNSIQHLTNLTELNLNMSLVTNLPIGLLQLPELENLMLFGTPLAKELNIAKNSHEAIDSSELKIVKDYVREYGLADEIADHEFVFHPE